MCGRPATKVHVPGTLGGCLYGGGSVDWGYDDEWRAYWGGGAGAGAGSGSGVHVVVHCVGELALLRGGGAWVRRVPGERVGGGSRGRDGDLDVGGRAGVSDVRGVVRVRRGADRTAAAGGRAGVVADPEVVVAAQSGARGTGVRAWDVVVRRRHPRGVRRAAVHRRVGAAVEGRVAVRRGGGRARADGVAER